MKINIQDIIDFEKVDVLLEGFNKSTGFVTAILDLEGNILSKSGWRQMCTHFHRVNPETSKNCTISDTVLAGKMADGEKYHFYKCLNGLVDVAVPIIINDEHVANLFSGQFFFERPDRSFFKKQAEKYGFDEKKYLEAFDKVPVVSKEDVKIAMDFLLDMTQLISDLAFQKLEQTELNLTISASEERQRMILQTAMDGFWMVDLNGKFIEVNDVACKMVGYSRAELLKLSISDLELVETAEQTQKHIQKVVETGEDQFETKHRCKNGQIVDVELSVKFQSAQNLIVLFVRDITERKQSEEVLVKNRVSLQEALEGSNRSRLSLLSVLEDQRRAQQELNKLNVELEQRVIERTLQLELANKELESFSYSVSHDLRAPLRGIDGFSLALYEDYQEKLDVTAKDYITRIRTATKKMDGLIDSLLKLSRISRLEMNLEVINLSTMVQEITKELKQNDKTRKASFIIQKDITIFADSNLMKIAIENLANNAWKFTSKNDKTIIEFGAFNENSKTVYFVKDNGIGFDMKYADKLFSAFQRLHSEKDYPGTGVGLSTVQRIIHRHNGTIWADSKLNEGTTFYFTLNNSLK